jgi:hypothetical protein
MKCAIACLQTAAINFAKPMFGQIHSSGWWYTYPSEKYDFVSWDDYSQ